MTALLDTHPALPGASPAAVAKPVRVENRTGRVAPASVLRLWETADVITRMLTSSPDLIEGVQDACLRLAQAERDSESPAVIEALTEVLHERQADLIAGCGELRALAAGGAR